jgi:hypothetical protein
MDLQLPSQRVRRPDLRCAPLGDSDVERLAGADDVGEGFHRLLERSGVVVPVGLVEVDIVGLQAPQRTVDRLHDVLAGQATVVVARPGRPEDLGEDLQAFAALPGQRAPSTASARVPA